MGSKLLDGLSHFIELTWLYLELHMLKIIMFSVMMLSVYNVSFIFLKLESFTSINYNN